MMETTTTSTKKLTGKCHASLECHDIVYNVESVPLIHKFSEPRAIVVGLAGVMGLLLSRKSIVHHCECFRHTRTL